MDPRGALGFYWSRSWGKHFPIKPERIPNLFILALLLRIGIIIFPVSPAG